MALQGNIQVLNATGENVVAFKSGKGLYFKI